MIFFLCFNLFAITVGVIDTGLTDKAAIFRGRVIKKLATGRAGSGDRHGHGTMVASIIVENSKKDVISCNATVSKWDHRISLSNTLKCLHRAIALGAREINTSFGGLRPSAARKRVIDHYWSRGVKFAASHGNRYGGPPSYPGQQEHVCSVQSLNADGSIARHSSSGTPCAQELGVNVPAWSRSGRRTYCTGSSCASPLWLARYKGAQ